MSQIKNILYYIGCVCYASSHDDLVGVFTDKALAEAECSRLNKEYLEEDEDRKSTVNAWGECFYVGEQDITGLVYGYEVKPEETDWIAVYSVPSLGEFQLFPRRGTAFEVYKVNTVEDPYDLNWDHEKKCYK